MIRPDPPYPDAPTSPSWSRLDELDPALGDIFEDVTRRIQAGELVDIEQLAGEHPAWAGPIHELLPALLGLAKAGQSVVNSAFSNIFDAEGRASFGDFRIIRELGRGGMGIVYEAQQASIARRVALKVMSPAAVLDARALQRFMLEAQVAGLLQHPHIVPIYTVGSHEGVPYYGMQFIEGGSLAELIARLRVLVGRGPDQPADIFSGESTSALARGLLSGRFQPIDREVDRDRHRMSLATKADAHGPKDFASIGSQSYIRSVVRLGIQVAEALGYAHDEGVVHRDVKPANLLLDRNGDLWVADFGMADVQGDAGLTLTGDLPGTLRYMSPEQAMGKRSLVDRRSDIYSLGATLYELLTLQPAVVGLDKLEMLRRIVEEEPTPIRRLSPAVPGDLATIVTKALAKDPSNRYETAWKLADDLNRFLDGKPIAARPVGPAARTWRWCRRKPMQAVLAASLIFAVVAGFGGITWNWRDAVWQRREAERQKGLQVLAEQRALQQAANAEAAEKKAYTQAAKADAINTFLIDKLLGQAEPSTNPNARRVTILEALDRAATEVGKSFTGQPEVEAAIRIAIGKTYHGLGEYARSVDHLRAARELLSASVGWHGKDGLEASVEMAHNLVHLGRLDEAEPLLKQSIDESRRMLGPDHELALDSRGYLARLYQSLGRLGEAEAVDRQLVEDNRQVYGRKDPRTLTAMNNLGVVLQQRNNNAEAETLFRECLEVYRQLLGPEHPSTLHALFNLGFVLNNLGQRDEALRLIRQSLDGSRRVLGPEHPATMNALSNLAAMTAAAGNREEAETLLRECLEARRRALGPNHPDTARTAHLLDHHVRIDAKPSANKPAPASDRSRP